MRTTGDPNQIVAAVRAAVAQIDPRAPLAEMQPMTAFVDKAMAPIRFTTTLIGIFAVVAVLLAAIGLYGVLSTIVRQRTAEIGMRMVFGAPRSSILQSHRRRRAEAERGRHRRRPDRRVGRSRA